MIKSQNLSIIKDDSIMPTAV